MSEHPPDIGAYYDDFWSGGDPAALAEHDYRTFQADLFAYVDGELGDLSGKRVLEVGPGLGLDTLRLLGKGAEVWSVDLSAASLHIVRDRCRAAGFGDRVHPVQMNGERLALPDAGFDVVYVQCTLMHADWPVVVRECRRVLRPGGRAVFVEPLRHHPAVAIYRATLSACKGSQPHYLSWWDFARIGRLFRRGKRRPFYFLSPGTLVVRRTPLEAPLRRVLKTADGALLRLPPLRPFAWYIAGVYEA